MDRPAHECTGKGVWPVVATGTEHWASICCWERSCLLLLDSWVTPGFFLCKKGKHCKVFQNVRRAQFEMSRSASVLVLKCAEPAKSAPSFPELPQSTCVTVTETGHCYKKNHPSNGQSVLCKEFNIKEGAKEVQGGE